MFPGRTFDPAPAPGLPPFAARRAERIAFDMLVRYAWRGKRATAMLKDLTRFGARIEGLEGLRKGDDLTLLLPGLPALAAQVAWAERHGAGLAFATPIAAPAFAALVRDFATGQVPTTPICNVRLPRAA